MKTLAIAVVLLWSGLASSGPASDSTKAAADQRGPASSPARSHGFWPTSTCRGCHPRQVEQHLESHHESSFTNPAFQAQYFEEVLPRASRDSGLAAEAQACTACHAPIAFATQQRYVQGPAQIDSSMSGVTCDVCHTITGYRGSQPRNGNFITEPGPTKLGPFKRETNWHHVYSELHTRSELCATCHEAENHHGVEVKATFTEWKKSPFATRGVQCQDCHMTRDGFLTAGRARYESGTAADMPGKAPLRDRLYTHRFPGAHSKSQVTGAITLDLRARDSAPVPGDQVAVEVVVDNSRTGHKMPTGSADLRLLWLTVTARVNGKPIALRAKSVESAPYDVAGQGKDDARFLGKDVPAGSRIYRAIFVDDQKRQTLSFYDAVAIPFDNRLAAAEKRVESYGLAIPKDARGPISIVARLSYLPYPSVFSRSMDLPRPQAVEVAVARQEIALR
jgi:hypothetical protein